MSYGEDMDTVDSYFADTDYEEDFEALCREREKYLEGKYIITCTSPKTGDTIYYQDRSISKKGFWTRYLCNAFGFRQRTAAEAYCKRLRYNKPKVKYVEPGTLNLTDLT